MKKSNVKKVLKVYALYKGEELVADGTIYDIAEQTGISTKTLYFYRTPSWKKRTTENAKRLVCIGKNIDKL